MLVARARLTPLGASQDDYELALTEEFEINPALLRVLDDEFNVSLSEERVPAFSQDTSGHAALEAAYRSVEADAEAVPGFQVASRLVLANFSYAKLPMVRDLEGAFDELVANDLIAAIAGDEESREKIREEFRDQEELVRDQAHLKTRHKPVRDFVRTAPDVLLALKPCWAMSPLVVSQLLPANTSFDVVVFDEASQITPADAASSILRGRS